MYRKLVKFFSFISKEEFPNSLFKTKKLVLTYLFHNYIHLYNIIIFYH